MTTPPASPPLAPSSPALNELVALLEGRRIVALTGAGCSTESGIPDYRGPETARRARNPMRFADFVASEAGRQRYWARSHVGWQRIERAQPNRAHVALAELEQRGLLDGVITQNVDGLHQAAGTQTLVELHGALAEVICLGCRTLHPRSWLQTQLSTANPGWGARRAPQAPDGDADLEGTDAFVVVPCPDCGGHLKPHVVFFGEGVPRDRVERARSMIDEAEALLIVGSSLAVFSGFRFVRRAHERGIPIAMVNLGPTRGDELVRTKVEAAAGEALPRLVAALG